MRIADASLYIMILAVVGVVLSVVFKDIGMMFMCIVLMVPGCVCLHLSNKIMDVSENWRVLDISGMIGIF